MPEVLHPTSQVLHASSVVNIPSAHYLYLQPAVIEFHAHLTEASVVLAASQTDLDLYDEQTPRVIQPAPLVVHVLSLSKQSLCIVIDPS